jgi:hypothetical protein
MAELFSGIKTTLSAPIGVFDIYTLIFNPTGKLIVDVCTGKEPEVLLQCVVGSDSAYISNTGGDAEPQRAAMNILCTFLHRIKHPVPVSDYTHVSITILAATPYSLKTPLLFKSQKHIFRAIITESPYNYFIKIGGKTFAGCMEIFIRKSNDPSLVAQIYSEKECGWDSFLESGEIVDMIKAALQLCNVLFDAYLFEFQDESNIECAKDPSDNGRLPRRILKPLSLGHLSIIDRNKTWYEHHFNAFLKDPSDREAYAQGLKKLDDPLPATFGEFTRKVPLPSAQSMYLEPLFNKSTTWREFLLSVPKMQRCEYLYWVPAFIDGLIGFHIRNPLWMIHVGSPGRRTNREYPDEMIRTNLLIQTHNITGMTGGKRSKSIKTLNKHKKTRKALRHKNFSIFFSFLSAYAGQVIR